jgi:hypothetical protein
VQYEFGRMIKILSIAAVLLIVSVWSHQVLLFEAIIRILLMITFVAALWTLVMRREERQFINLEFAAFRQKVLG